MPVTPLIDLSRIDLDKVLYGRDAIRDLNPHRYEFELLDAVVHMDSDELTIAGYHQTSEKDFWVRGHIPGNPLFPGALMVECAAQLSSFYYRSHFGQSDRFFGFGGIENVKFRGMVSPGQRFVVVGKGVKLNRRRSLFNTQGYVDGQMVFEGDIIGVTMPVPQQQNLKDAATSA